MATCRYYIKKTNNPRICCKNAPQDFCEQGVCGLHLCNHHFNVVQTQLVNTIEGGDFNLDCQRRSIYFKNQFQRRSAINQIIEQWDEYQVVQMISLLQFQRDEFFRESEKKYNTPPPDLLEDEWQNILTAFQILEDDAKVDVPNPADGKVTDVSEKKKDCPICLEQFSSKNMTFLQCAHALCNGCLREIERRNVAQQCPVCRHRF